MKGYHPTLDQNLRLSTLSTMRPPLLSTIQSTMKRASSTMSTLFGGYSLTRKRMRVCAYTHIGSISRHGGQEEFAALSRVCDPRPVGAAGPGSPSTPMVDRGWTNSRLRVDKDAAAVKPPVGVAAFQFMWYCVSYCMATPLYGRV